MDREIGWLNECVWPNTSYEFLFADQITWSLNQGNEDI